MPAQVLAGLEKLATASKCAQSGTPGGWSAGSRLLLHSLAPAGRRIALPIPSDSERRSLVIRAKSSDYAAYVTCIVDAVYRVPDTHASYAAAWLAAIHASGCEPLVVDAGANIGASAAMLTLEWPSASVLAIEPAPENAAMLGANMARFPRVTVLREALAAREGWVSLEPGTTGFDSFQTSVVGENAPVRARSITGLLDRCTAKPFFLKVDVEGAEGEVFRDERVWDFPIIAIEAHDWLFPFDKRLEPFLSGHIRKSRDLLVAGAGVLFSIAEPCREATSDQIEGSSP